MKEVRTYYIIFDNYGALLNITWDYFYFKRLVKKYQENDKKIFARRIGSKELLEISTEVNI